jgi:hypothetical protein
VQDTWKATDKLTLTYGLRAELLTPGVEVANREANFDPNAPGGAVVIAGSSAPCGRALRCIDYKDFAPHFGVSFTTTILEDGIPPVIVIPVTNGMVLLVAGAPYTAAYEDPHGRSPHVQQRRHNPNAPIGGNRDFERWAAGGFPEPRDKSSSH